MSELDVFADSELDATGAEIAALFARWRLDAGARADLYRRVLSSAASPTLADRVRMLGLDRRTRALAGGSLVTVAAALAVVVARGRGRRQDASALASGS